MYKRFPPQLPVNITKLLMMCGEYYNFKKTMQEKISGCLLKKGDWIYPEGHFAGFHRNDDGVRLPPVMCDPA